jgi:hypothetical protein
MTPMLTIVVFGLGYLGGVLSTLFLLGLVAMSRRGDRVFVAPMPGAGASQPHEAQAAVVEAQRDFPSLNYEPGS